jgi:hypothetical protein
MADEWMPFLPDCHAMTVILEYIAILNLTGTLFGDQDAPAFATIDCTMADFGVAFLFNSNTSIGVAKNVTVFHHPQGMLDEANSV